MLVYISLPHEPFKYSQYPHDFCNSTRFPGPYSDWLHSVCDPVRSCAFELQADAEPDVNDMTNKGHKIDFALQIGHTSIEMSHEKRDKALISQL